MRSCFRRRLRSLGTAAVHETSRFAGPLGTKVMRAQTSAPSPRIGGRHLKHDRHTSPVLRNCLFLVCGCALLAGSRFPASAEMDAPVVARLSWNSAESVSHLDEIPRAALPVFIVLEDAPSYREIALRFEWTPNGTGGSNGYRIVPPAAGPLGCLVFANTTEPQSFQGESDYDWVISGSPGPGGDLCIALQIEPPSVDVGGRFCLVSGYIVDDSSVVHPVLATNAATIGRVDGLPSCTAYIYEVVPNIIDSRTNVSLWVNGNSLDRIHAMVLVGSDGMSDPVSFDIPPTSNLAAIRIEAIRGTPPWELRSLSENGEVNSAWQGLKWHDETSVDVGTSARGRVFLRGTELSPPYTVRYKTGIGTTINDRPTRREPSAARIPPPDSASIRRHNVDMAAGLLGRQLRLQGLPRAQANAELEQFYLESDLVDSVSFVDSDRIVYWKGAAVPEAVIVRRGASSSATIDPNPQMLEYSNYLLQELVRNSTLLIFDVGITIVPESRASELASEIERIRNGDESQPFRILKLEHTREVMRLSRDSLEAR